MLQVLRGLFVRLLDGPLRVNTDAAENKTPADDTFKKESQLEFRWKVQTECVLRVQLVSR